MGTSSTELSMAPGQAPVVLPQVSLHTVPSQNPFFPNLYHRIQDLLVPTYCQLRFHACRSPTPVPARVFGASFIFHIISCLRIGTMLFHIWLLVHTSKAL